MGVNNARTKTLVFGVSAAMCASGGALFAISGNLASPEVPNFTLLGSIVFLLVMVLGGAATLWGPIVGAIVYVVIETRTREGEGAVGEVSDWLFGWILEGSPARLILAIILLAMMFLAPFGIVGLLKRIAARFVVIVPTTAGTNPAIEVDEAPPPAVDEPFLSITTGETSP
jgi:ABC-type branched-subunit amino acid transport system permease subunit